MYKILSLTMAIGLGFIVLGIEYFVGGAKIDKFTIFCFSLSGFFFLIGDYCEFKKQEFEKENARKHKFWRNVQGFVTIMAIFLVVLFPHMNPNISNENMDKLINTTMLIGLGITILLIGHKDEKSLLDKLLNIQKEVKVANTEIKKIKKELIEMDSENEENKN